MVALERVLAHLDDWYPPHTAEPWDAVGLVWGDPAAEVRRILLAVDPVAAVAAEAVAEGADLLVVHHPLFLKPVHGVPATTPKGRVLAGLAGAGCALFSAHTNADQALGGVSEALATGLGLTDLVPIQPAAAADRDKIVCFVPEDSHAVVRAAMSRAGAGVIGDYEGCSFSLAGTGRFLPGAGADPVIGERGQETEVPELRLEMISPRARRTAVVRALLQAHPYEEPAFDIYPLGDPGTASTGTGRIGTIPQTTLSEFAAHVAQTVPRTAQGIRVAGDPDRPIRRVALCGGAGDFLLDAIAAAEVDVYLTSDLRHHPASEFTERAGPALIDVPHWAAEWMWLPVLRDRLARALGDTVTIRVSTQPTDAWTLRIDPLPEGADR